MDRRSRATVRTLLEELPDNAAVLELGCGTKPLTGTWGPARANVYLCDISPTALHKAVRQADTGSAPKAAVTDGATLCFDDSSFDAVLGISILHHLNLHAAYREVSRVLRLGGTGIFLEPLDHNPVIRLFRSATPGLRSEDEAPLREQDIRAASPHFSNVKWNAYNLLTPLSLPLLDTPVGEPVLSLLERAEQKLFRAAPFFRRYAWISVLRLRR